MQSWNSRKSFLYFLTIMVMVLALAVAGCSDDDDDDVQEVRAEDLEARTFIFPDAGFFDPDLAGLEATLDFEAQDANGDLPFTLSFDDPANTELRGTATVGSPLNCPTDRANQNDAEVPFPITITAPESEEEITDGEDLCDGTDVVFGDGTLEFTKDGVTIVFDVTGGTGSTAE
jgi:hypothetical protein